MHNHESSSITQKTVAQQWTLFQLADANFPSGGFAHSNGLEALYKAAIVTDQSSFHPALQEYIDQLMNTQMPYIAHLHLHQDQFTLANDHCHTTLMNAVANQASRTQGKAFLSAATKIFANNILSTTYHETLKTNVRIHFAPVFGYITYCLGLDLKNAAQLFLYINARDWTSAAVRLNIIGPIAAQRILNESRHHFIELTSNVHSLTLDDVYQSLPLFDITHACHNRIYSKLFQS